MTYDSEQHHREMKAIERQGEEEPADHLKRLPDAALERLIQHHPDLAVVERLRAERLRHDAVAAAPPSRSSATSEAFRNRSSA